MSITLSYPAFAVTQVSTITIKAPEMLDGEASTYELVVHLTRDSNFRTVVSKPREGTEIYVTTLDFVDLCQIDKDLLEPFLLASQGEYVLYTDYNGKEWYTTIIQEDFDFITTGAGLSYSISLTMNRWEK